MIKNISKRYSSSIFLLAFMLVVQFAFCQVPEPCTNPPNGPGCLCSTAGILCTPDDLDGFTFSMSSTPNLGDLPSGFFSADLCPGIGSQGGTPNNVNFFAFIVWCEDLTFDVLVTNCQDNPDDFFNSYGVQLAVFGACGSQNNGWEPVACLTDGQDYCYDTAAEVPPVQTISATGLEVGGLYYFMLDGCARSTCDITIDVQGVCGTGMIDQWTTGIEGETSTCVGATDTYTAEDVDGAVEFYYYLDGVLIDDGEDLLSTDITWDTPGTYELCVDVSNLPCVEESAEPPQDCITINVIGIGEAEIEADPEVLCPDEISTITVTNENLGPDLTDHIIITGPDGNTVYQITDDLTTTLTYDACGTFTAYYYNYITADNPPIPVVGDSWTPPGCDADCCDIVSVEITFEDTEDPIFTNPPGDISLDCALDLLPIEDLEYTDNCIDDGIVMGQENGDYTLCDGGEITRFWVVTDSCGNSANHTQIINITGILEASFTTMPADEEIDCGTLDTNYPSISATNGQVGSCSIDTIIEPTIVEDFDDCDGTVTLTWTFTDVCDRTISHTKTITILPPIEAEFVDPPGDLTVDCDAVPITAPDLDYTNSVTGTCEIIGSAPPEIVADTSVCGGTITNMWEYMDDCDRVISHTQVITINPPAEPTFDQLPADIDVACGDIVPDAIDLTVSNGGPGRCNITEIVSPTVIDDTDICDGTITYTWEYTNNCGTTLSHTQTITILPPDEASFLDPPGDVTIICSDIPNAPTNLEYTNALTGDCAIMGDVPPTVTENVTECGGTIENVWEFTDDCGRTISHTQVITVEPAPEAAFIDPPDDITVSCAGFDDDPPMLAYNNGLDAPCQISGMEPGDLVGTPTPCGVPLQYVWTHTDECGRTITASQNITVEAAAPPEYVNLPPLTISFECIEVPSPSDIPDLNYTNGETGICAIQGSDQGFQSGTYDACGGDLTYTWSFTDECGTNINFTQMVTVLPAPEPMWVDPPEDLVLECEDEFPDPLPLEYTNGETGDCGINGFVNPTVVMGEVYEYTWTFTNDCSGLTITHTQIVSGVETPDIVIDPNEDAICIGESYDLTTLTVTDLNGQSLTLQYLNQNGQEIDPNVQPTETTTYTILATNEDGCTDEEIFILFIDTPPTAGGDGSLDACTDEGSYNLFDYIVPPFDLDGTWFDSDLSGANIDDPFNANFNGVIPGTYVFEYVVFSTNSCPQDNAFLTITVIDEIDFEIFDAQCNDAGTSYSVTVLSYGNTIIASEGDVNVVDQDTVIISNIPNDQILVVTAFDPVSFCTTNLLVNAPDCDCPDVPAPINDGNPSICEDETIPELSVSTESGLFANWYDVQSGGTPLIEMSNTYTPTISGSGIYTFYVEAENPDECVSLIRTEVSLEVIALPSAEDVQVSICAFEDGSATFDLDQINPLVNSNQSFTFSYHPTLSDAENGTSEINSSYTISSNMQVFVKVVSGSGCINYATADLIILELPEIAYDIIDEVCLGEGNGQLIINSVTPQETLTSLDQVDYSNDTVIDSLEPGNYMLYLLTDDGCTSSQSFDIDAGISIQLSDISLECFSNGTAGNSDDDYYEVSITVNVNPASNTMFEIIRNGVNLGMYTYGDPLELTLDADGLTFPFEIVDMNTGCIWEVPLDPLVSCSTDCEITAEPILFECQDNDTPTDPSDDFYIITLNADAVNGAQNNTFNVTVDGAPFGNFEYGIGGTIQLPATGQNVQISIIDNADIQCFTSESIGPLTSCSGACIVQASIDVVCNSNNTTGVTTDDFYDISITASGANVGSQYRLLIDGQEVGTFNYNELISQTIPADEATHDIEIIDIDNTDCSFSFTTGVLSTCSGNCEITAISSEIECDNNATGADELDDTYTAFITIDIIDGSGTWTIIEEGQTGTSGSNIQVGPYLIADGDVTLTIADNNISSCTTTITLTAPEPCSECNGTVDAGSDFILDCDVQIADLIGTSSMPGSPNWSGPGGFSVDDYTASTDVPGTYYFSVDFGESCVFIDSALVSVSNDIPTAIAGENMSLTCEVDTILLTGTVTGGSGNFQYTWTDENGVILSTSLELEITTIGNYFFSVFDINTDCTSPPSVVTIEDLTAGPSAIIYADPGNILDCVIELIYITNEIEDNVVYSWIVNGQPIETNNISIEEPSEISLIAIDTITGCESSNNLSIPSLQEYPIIELVSDGLLNCIDTEITLDGSNSQLGDDITSTWYNENEEVIATNVTQIEVDETGTYYLELIDTENGCTNRDTILVEGEFNYPIVSEGSELSIGCDEDNLELSAIIEGDISALNILWSTDDGQITSNTTDQSVIVSEPGNYVISVIDPISMCETTSNFIVYPSDEIESVPLELMNESCIDNADGAIIINDPVGGTPPYSYYVQNQLYESNIINDLSSGSYNIEIIDAEGCEFNTTVTIEVLENFEISLLSTIEATRGENVTLNAQVNIPDSEIDRVQWSPSIGLSCDTCLTTILTTDDTTPSEYSVTVTDINGCDVMATVRIDLEDVIIITFPNIFSPNGDNNGNDNFTAYSTKDGVDVISLKVFDRWGEMIYFGGGFKTNIPRDGWDGTFEGRDVVPGVFVYFAELAFPDGSTESYSGDVTVIR